MDDSVAKAQSSDASERPNALTRMLSFHDPYGWTAKIGLILPASNTICEPEWARFAPDGVSIHTARVSQSGRSTTASFDAMAQETATAAAQLATAAVDVIAYGCTSGSFMSSESDIMRRITERARCPVTNSARSAIEALRALDAKKVALATPYMDYIHEREIEFLHEEGFSVVGSLNLRLGETEAERFAIRNIPPKAVFRMATAVDRPDADAIFLSCTSMASATIIPAIESRLGKPVVTSNQATFWNALRLLGLRIDIASGGRLMSQRPAMSGSDHTAKRE